MKGVCERVRQTKVMPLRVDRWSNASMGRAIGRKRSINLYGYYSALEYHRIN